MVDGQTDGRLIAVLNGQRGKKPAARRRAGMID
jgi:hypothetical protein